MDTTSLLPEPLSDEDFDRLGISPQECRLSVIRQAATRAALVARQSDGTLPEASRPAATPAKRPHDLTLVATSTYRLLDPRRRRTVTERTHVGRILPNALLAASQTNFHSAPFSNPTRLTTTPDAEETELTPLVGDSTTEDSFVLKLREKPLSLENFLSLRPVPVRREHPSVWHRRTQYIREQIHEPRVIIGLIFALLFTSAWLFAWQNPEYAPRPQITAKTTPETTTSLKGESTQPPSPAPSESNRAPDPNQPNRSESTDDPGIKPTTAPDVTVSAETVVPSAPAPKPFGLFQVLPRRKHPQVLYIRSTGKTHTAATQSMPSATLQTAFKDAEPAGKHTSFSLEETTAIVTQAVSTLAPPSVLANRADIDTLGTGASLLAENVNAGSPDHWAFEMLASLPSCFDAKLATFHQRWVRLATLYEVTFPQFAYQTWNHGSNLSLSAPLRRDSLQRGLTIAHYLLALEQLDLSKGVLDEIQRQLKSQNDTTIAVQASSLLDALAQAQRSQPRVKQRVAVENHSASEAGIIGRHLCFSNLDWTQGLEYLNRGSDVRLAATARQELDLKAIDPVSPEALMELAERWLAIGERHSGRPAESIIMHAIELLETAKSDASEIQRLECSRRINALKDTVSQPFRDAVELLRVSSPTESNAPPSLADQVSKSTEVISPSLLSFVMNGSVQPHAFAEPQPLRYESGGVIAPSILASVYKSLDGCLHPSRIDCLATLMVGPSPASDAARLPPSLRLGINVAVGGGQEVFFDDNQVDLDPLDGTAEVVLSPGQHTVRWTADIQTHKLFLELYRVFAN